MTEPIISVIIPVYKVEKYLHQCINSVIDQTYANMEIILVDDGSTDDCPRICDNYAQQDSRFIVIHKSNGGSSSARNAGIKAATGDYIIFLDSDDYWDDISAMQDLVMQIFEFESDVITWGYKKLFDESIKVVPFIVDRNLVLKRDKEDAFYVMLKCNSFIASACNKLIRRKLFEENCLWFNEGSKSEDIEWCARLALFSESFDIYESNFYIYRQRSGSISKTISEKNIEDLESSISSCLKLLPTHASNQFSDSLYAYTAVQYANYLISLNSIGEEYRDKHYSFVKQQQYLLQYGFSARVKIIRICSKVVGIKSTIALLGRAAKCKKR